MDFEKRVQELGIDIPDHRLSSAQETKKFSAKPFHIVGSLLLLGGHVPQYPDGRVLYPGRLGDDVTVEQGYEAARLAGLNCLAGIRLALGDLNRVRCIVRSLNFVKCTPDFEQVSEVANGATDLFRDVFGEEYGVGARATVGVASLSSNMCFENWLTVEVS